MSSSVRGGRPTGFPPQLHKYRALPPSSRGAGASRTDYLHRLCTDSPLSRSPSIWDVHAESLQGHTGGDEENWFRDGRIWHELAPEPDDIVVYKPSYGAFYDTPLETILKNLACDTIIICGALTNLRCGVTARQGYERGFRVVFGSDATATDDPDLQDAELKVLRKGFAMVISADAIVRALEVE
jgi:nicotinamidase-related amidase